MIDLSQEFYPCPKVFKAKKEPKPLNKIGKKTRASLDAVAEMKLEYAAVGITECEIKFPKICWRNNALSFAHLKKRRKLSKEDIKKTVLACIPCHDTVEIWPAEEMEQFLQDIINKRKVQP
jgi:hypothetical protein